MQQKLLTTILLFLCLFSCTKEVIDLPKEILSFETLGLNATKAVIDPIKKTISLEVPYNSSLKEITPILKVNDGVTLVPASGLKQDFSKPVFYTLIAADGSKAIYTILIKTAEQPLPILEAIKTDSVEAGFPFEISGKNFGRFQLDVTTYLVDSQNKEILVENVLIDSSRIKLNVPSDTKPESYQVKLLIKQKQIVSTQKVFVQYPKPQLVASLSKNLLQGDSLYIKGKYIDAQKYKISLALVGKTKTTKLESPSLNSKGLGFVLPKALAVGQYSIVILNETTTKKSVENGFEISVYDSEKPTITGFVNKKVTYKPNEQVQFQTKNFEKISTRFYQMSLKSGVNTYFVNGVYDSKKQLNVDLPNTIQKGSYTISVSFINSEGKENYAFEIDDVLSIQ